MFKKSNFDYLYKLPYRYVMADYNMEFMQKEELNISSAGSMVIPNEVKTPYLGQAHICDGFIFCLCLNGEGVVRINHKEHKVRAGMVVTILPHSIVEAVEQSSNAVYKLLLFPYSYISLLTVLFGNYEFLAKVALQPVIAPSKEVFSDFVEVNDFTAKQLKRADSSYQKELAQAFFVALIVKVKSLYHKKELAKHVKPLRNEQLTHQFINLVLKNYKKERNMAFYADKLCLTPKYLSAIIKKTTGNPAPFWINKVLIIDSKFKLKTTNQTVLQISEELNFNTPSIFGRFFKQHTGLTPLEYRNS